MKHEAPRMHEAAPMWRAGSSGTLLLPHCTRCDGYVWPPRAGCARCGGPLAWRAASGRGSVASFSVVRRAVDPAHKDSVPYVVGLVALDEGVRLFTNLVDVAPENLAIGMRVRCRFERSTDDEAWVPVFGPEA